MGGGGLLGRVGYFKSLRYAETIIIHLSGGSGRTSYWREFCAQDAEVLSLRDFICKVP